MHSEKNRINDCTIKIATVNGTGSASANGLLLKALFRMGIPVTGKNLFPSNIQGLPTWFEIRVNHKGYMARSGRVDVMVALNAQTYERDLEETTAGGIFIYDSTWPRERSLVRDDVTILGVPLSRMCNEHFDQVRTRILMKNVACVGALAALLAIDMSIIKQLLEETFAAKPKLIKSNLSAVELGYEYAQQQFSCPLSLKVEHMDETNDHIMIQGNTAAALGCLYAGATVGAWYPITPSTSLMDAFKSYCEKYRHNPVTGENNYCIIQAEDELAAIGMVIGANWAGARAFTPTSGPGISLMSEFIGFAYFTEIPAVLFDIQRVGPSTGMPTRTQQGDILSCAYASHGDTRHVLLFPANPEECFYLAVAAFDLAERLQTPVFVLSDLDIGMNDWMCPELNWDDEYQPDRGKVLNKKQLDELEKFYRYMDVDGDGICARTLPGESEKGAYFVRGSGHNQYGAYTEDESEYQAVLDRLNDKWETASTLVPKPVIQRVAVPTQFGVISIGGCDGAIIEALDLLEEAGIDTDYLRIKAFPFSYEVIEFLQQHQQLFVVEQNRDAQLRSLLILETDVPKTKLVSVLRYDGLPMDAHTVYEAISRRLSKEAVA